MFGLRTPFFKCVVVAALLVGASRQQADDEFAEELLLKPLPSGHINSFFQFSTSWTLDQNDSLDHIHLVARPIAEIFQRFDIAELHVSLTHGLWRHDKWGYPPVDAAMGAEVWAWFSRPANASEPPLNDARVDAQWKLLVDTLSGLFCASLTFVDSSNTLRPKFSFQPQFADGTAAGPAATQSARFVRYATLPREIVCTENLTPWKKLLPCRSHHAGLVSLLTSGHIHGTNYHSLGLHLRSLRTSPHGPRRLELKQTANLVFDKALISANGDWSMRKLFGQGLAAGPCQLAATSYVYVDVTEPNDEYVLTPTPDRRMHSLRGGSITKLAVYDLHRLPAGGAMFHIAAAKPKATSATRAVDAPVALYQAPPLHVRRFLLGAGQERGQIFTRITNTHWAPLNVVLHENLPWFVPAYLHTLRVRDDRTGASITPAALHYAPGVRRERPSQLEVAFAVPARSTATVRFDIDYIHLRWLEYPPDANHGHYIGAATISAQLPVARNYTGVPLDGFLLRDAFNASRAGGYVVQLRTESLLITLPTPDFSMPYNVICLACTVVALAFGPMHNMATKRIALVEQPESVADADATEEELPVSGIRGVLRRLCAKIPFVGTPKSKSE